VEQVLPVLPIFQSNVGMKLAVNWQTIVLHKPNVLWMTQIQQTLLPICVTLEVAAQEISMIVLHQRLALLPKE
jgi:hypothetical protein